MHRYRHYGFTPRLVVFPDDVGFHVEVPAFDPSKEAPLVDLPFELTDPDFVPETEGATVSEKPSRKKASREDQVDSD
jgi:hypothetical protein